MSTFVTMQGLTGAWPDELRKYAHGPRDQQTEIFRFVAANGSCTIEGPTGLGKGVVEYVIATAAARKLNGVVYWIVPTRALVQQFAEEFPDMVVAYGRNEYPCAWAAEEFDEELNNPITPDQLVQLQLDPEAVKVSDVATMVCKKCPHFVDQETGQTQQRNVVSCPYYQQKFRVKHADRVLCTMSFYIYQHIFIAKKDRAEKMPVALVIDEVHKLPRVVKYSLSYDITDHHLQQSIELLDRLGDDATEERKIIRRFRIALIKIAQAKNRKASVEMLLEDSEIRRLIDILEPIDAQALGRKVKAAVAARVIRPREDRMAIKRLEILVRDLRRYVNAFVYSTDWEDEEGEVRRPLNYTCSFYRTEREVVAEAEATDDKRRRKKVTHKLVIHCAYVAALIRKCLLSKFTVGLSATIGNEEMFSFISGIRYPLLRLDSAFPVENRRIYAPTDTPSLAFDAPGSQREKTRMLREVAKQCRWFADKRRGWRSLVVVVSEAERKSFLQFAEREGLDVTTYGNGTAAKDAVSIFKGGEGKVLVGTTAHFSEGVDLPSDPDREGELAVPIIFLLRPSFPNPHSPEQEFMIRRFGNSTTWKINWYEVMQQVNQTAGRNIRSATCRGIIILVDQRFRRFAFGALPQWLEPAYQARLDWNGCIDDVVKLLRQ